MSLLNSGKLELILSTKKTTTGGILRFPAEGDETKKLSLPAKGDFVPFETGHPGDILLCIGTPSILPGSLAFVQWQSKGIGSGRRKVKRAGGG